MSRHWIWASPEHYCIAVDGKWIGRYNIYQSVRYYAVGAWKTLESALKFLGCCGKTWHDGVGTNQIRGEIEIFRSWGSWPEQRTVVKTIEKP